MVKGSGKMSMKFDTSLEQFLKNLQRALDYYNTQDYIWTWLFSSIEGLQMPQFLFQPDPIDKYEFNPIPIDIHLGIIKIPTEEILDDDAINNTESIIVGTDRQKY